ncbi:MAG: zinc ribbon domain-containing protein [Acidiferrobacterales bacterium]|nr:zinc ribbon domain-containing protein [Acidiferrobacterales bacterium]
MPIYEYVCEDCDYELEIIQRIKEARLTRCPACNEESLRRKLSAAAFHLKGTGWYETDFKTKKPDDEKSKKSESGDSKSADSSESEKKDSTKKSSASDDKASKSTETTT